MNLVCRFVLLSLLLTGAVTASAQSRAEKTVRYPNELPNLQLYAKGKWQLIIPYVSSRTDVERLLGTPTRIYDSRFYVTEFDDYLVGYDHDQNWVFVVTYVAGDCASPALVGRVANITLYPRQRISLQAVNFPEAFSRSTYENGKIAINVYSDKFGLRYSVYTRVSVGDGHNVGDLQAITYGASSEEESLVLEKKL